MFAGSDIVWREEDVTRALDRMAAEIDAAVGERFPVIVCVMLGGLIPAARLLARFEFPLEIDYVHATRYRGGTKGHDLHWKAKPATALAGREVLVVDDILDEGVTLRGVLDYCEAQGASAVYSAVLVDKQHGRTKAVARADFTGLEVDDRYVFGCGMDYKGSFRNLRSIHALAAS